MDGLTEMLQGILNSEEGKQQVKAIADMLGLSQESPQEEQPLSLSPAASQAASPDLSELFKIAELFKNAADNQNTVFLRSLKPLLSPERQPKVEQAIRILRLTALLPMLRESGFLQDLMGDFFEGR